MTIDEGKTFKILSIDGGGIKGLYSCTVIRHLEEHFQCNMSDYFDMLCGTSTGGLIALALSLKVPTADICKFYEEDGPKIFKRYSGCDSINSVLMRELVCKEGHFFFAKEGSNAFRIGSQLS